MTLFLNKYIVMGLFATKELSNVSKFLVTKHIFFLELRQLAKQNLILFSLNAAFIRVYHNFILFS